ncbi:MAG: IS21 family transposase [Nitrospirae bacterium]|nr:IS21 family transposase [Nitrospirota bacterium]
MNDHTTSTNMEVLMVNALKMAQGDAISGLLALGWSHRRIARELGVNRETVSRYARLQQSPSNPAIPTPGPSSRNLKSGRQSHCVFFDEIIKKKIEQKPNAQRIYQDIVADHEFSGSYSSVKRYVRSIREKTPLPFRRMEVEPGTEGQVDYGQGWWLKEDGKLRKAHVLRIVLSHSRKGYSEAVLKESTQAFIRILENSFYAFGGVPETLVPDNTSSAVKKADWYDPELHPINRDFCRHYGTVLLPTRSYSPNLVRKWE